MHAFEIIAETRIQEALAKGTLDSPLAGRPLDLQGDADVPRELRAAFRVLHSAGYLPEELELRNELVRLDRLIAACHDEGPRRSLRSERSSASLRLDLMLERRGLPAAARGYEQRLRARVR